MEQRRLRLGDILDDYCPRERRVTNHVIVAMVDDDIKQTRCTTCDAEHPYKGGKAPRRRKSESVVVPAPPALPMSRPAESPMSAATERPATHDESEIHDEPAVTEAPASEPPAQASAAPAATQDGGVDEGPVHRPLIRATLPRPEGIKTERPAPEFTIRQNGGRGNGNFRGFPPKGRGGHAVNAGRSGGGPRFGRGPQGRGQGRGGASSGFGRGGPKKRSR